MKSQALLQAAFRDVHGARLHGFALLVTLGDRSVAAPAASRALAEGARRAAELRHPDRAAAWLRRRLLGLLPHGSAGIASEPEPDRRATIRALGAPPFVFDALAALPIHERAILVAGAIERFEPLDVAAIASRSVRETLALQTRARTSYLSAALAAMPGPDDEPTVPHGEIAARVLSDAVRTMGGGIGRP